MEQVVHRFVELQSDDLNEGLVFREFIEFEPVGVHPKSGMPLTREYRRFVLDGQVVECGRYWNEGRYRKPIPVQGPNQRRQEPLFQLDIAKTKNGNWLIVELGDGQVTGLPPQARLLQFYEKILQQLR